MTFVAVAIVGTAAVGGAIKYGSARKQELKANKASRAANDVSAQASAALAAAEAEGFVPGFSTATDRIPGYHKGVGIPKSAANLTAIQAAQKRNSEARDRALGREIPQPTRGLGQPVLRDRFSGDDVGDRASRTMVQPGDNYMDRGYQEAVRGGYDPTTGVTMREGRGRNVVSELLRKRFEEVTRTLPRNPAGLPIFPDPNTKEGKDFYSTLPKSIADMASDPNMAQMYKGSNIVNPYANVKDLSGIAEDASDLLRDRSDLLSDRTDLIQDRTDLLSDRSGLFESATGLGSDLSTGLADLSTSQENLSTGLEDLSQRVTDLRPGAQDFSGLASDTSVLTSNAFANLQVATQAADLQAQQSDQALANTLSTIRATGAGAGGATAIAQAALQSKLNISATIEQQEARNVQSRAQGQQQVEQIRMSESKRLQDIAFSEKIRLEGLRQSEGLRIDDTRLDEGRRLQGVGLDEGRRIQGVGLDEGRRLQELGVSEGRRLQELGISEKLREQGLRLDESLRLQQAQFDTARERDRFAFDEAGRLQTAQYDEAGRLQAAKFGENLRLQQTKIDEQQRLQQADSMAREYQFRVAETREQNRLNRLAGQETQAVQNAASLEAAKVSAKAQRQGALASGITGLASAAIGAAGAGAFGGAASAATSSSLGAVSSGFGAANSFSPSTYSGLKGLPTYSTTVPLLTNKTGTSDRRLKKNIKLIGKSNSGLNIYMFEYIDKIFGSGIYQGVMSDEIPQYAVINHADGYDRVDYSKIDVDFKEI